MSQRAVVPLALLSMYLIWGSTYLGIVVALESLPPLSLAGTRLLLAGGILFLFLWRRGAAFPTPREWRSAAIVGSLMLGGGVGGTTFAEQWVASGLAAVLVAMVPLWATLFAGFWERWPTRREWLGLTTGFVGVVLLNLDANLRANPLGATIMFLAPISWAFGSVLSRRLPLPKGPMAFAAEMLAGGAVLLLLGLLRGEALSGVPTVRSVVAWLYLALFGSLLAYSAYMYLLQTVSVTLATSYAYVNPVVAVLLGVAVAGEVISPAGYAGMIIILAAVLVITLGGRRRTRRVPS